MKTAFHRFIAKHSNSRLAKRIKRWIFLLEIKLQSYYQAERFITVLHTLARDKREVLFFASELQVLMSMSESLRHVEGSYAEVGVFQGTSAKAICEFKGHKDFHLFDTFEGLPEVDQIDEIFKSRMFNASRQELEERLDAYENIHIHEGLFPNTTKKLKEETFAFVHLDVDLYQCTKDALDYFYPRLASGGVIISHDYHLKGVQKAVDEFNFKNGMMISLPFSQCAIIKH